MKLCSIVLSQFQLAFLRWWILPWVFSRMYTDDHYSIIIGQKVIYHHVDFETHIIILRYYKLYISIMIVCCLPLDFIWLALSNTYVSWFLDDHPNGLGWDQKPVIISHQYDISPYGPQNESIQESINQGLWVICYLLYNTWRGWGLLYLWRTENADFITGLIIIHSVQDMLVSGNGVLGIPSKWQCLLWGNSCKRNIEFGGVFYVQTKP